MKETSPSRGKHPCLGCGDALAKAEGMWSLTGQAERNTFGACINVSNISGGEVTTMRQRKVADKDTTKTRALQELYRSSVHF